MLGAECWYDGATMILHDPSSLVGGYTLQVGDDAYLRFEDGETEYAGRVLGRDAGGEIKTHDALPHGGYKQNAEVLAHKWPPTKPLIVVKRMEKANQPVMFKAWWHDDFICPDIINHCRNGELFGYGETAETAMEHLVEKWCRVMGVEMPDEAPTWELEGTRRADKKLDWGKRQVETVRPFSQLPLKNILPDSAPAPARARRGVSL